MHQAIVVLVVDVHITFVRYEKLKNDQSSRDERDGEGYQDESETGKLYMQITHSTDQRSHQMQTGNDLQLKTTDSINTAEKSNNSTHTYVSTSHRSYTL